ncbi:MAG: VOC family protein [Pseudomonadota bacterium]
MVKLDHIVIGCNDLMNDQAAVATQLGLPPAARGKHEFMGTHNALWNMGAYYIELVAINPEAPNPGRPYWFGLGDEGMQAHLSNGPRLISWAVSVDDVAMMKAVAPIEMGEIESFARGELKWNTAVPTDGLPGMEGAYPLTINWTEGTHPAERLPDMGFRCNRLTISHPDIDDAIEAIGAVDGPVDFVQGPARLTCEIMRADGSMVTFD